MPVTKGMLENVLEKLRADTKREVIRIRLCDDTPRLFESKFGGRPYLPRGVNPPVDCNGNVLRLLAQINMQELPHNDTFPAEGILQFWVLNDDFAGVDFEAYCTTDASRVLFWDNIDTSITTEEVKKKYQPYIKGKVDYFPVEDELRLHFLKSVESISTEHYLFRKIFMNCWKTLYPNSDLVDFYDLPDDLLRLCFESLSGFGNKLLGYPAFTQDDPRGYVDGMERYDTLLLQIDSGGTESCEIMWGDSGIGNFFISKEDLLRRDFTKVIYTWDCC